MKEIPKKGNEKFVPRAEYSACPKCGTILGDLVAYEAGEERVTQARVCCSPVCTGKPELVEGLDPSFLYRTRALIFIPEEELADYSERGHIVAVHPDEVPVPVLRRDSPVIVTDVRWPADRKRFIELFSHHIHHERAPNVTPLNDGWDASRKVPVL